MTFRWPEDPWVPVEPRPWPTIEVVTPANDTVDVPVDSSIWVGLTNPEGARKKVCEEDRDGRYCATTVLDSAVLTNITSGEEVPVHFEWNEDRTGFYLVPEELLVSNTYHAIIVDTHAEGSLVQGGYEQDQISYLFRTAEQSMNNLHTQIERTWPYEGQQHYYTGYPIRIDFKKHFPELAQMGLNYRLYRVAPVPMFGVIGDLSPAGGLVPAGQAEEEEEAEAPAAQPRPTEVEVPGTLEHRYAGDVFTPVEHLQPNMNYIFRISKPTGYTFGEETWYELSFRTGAYPSFREMLESAEFTVEAAFNAGTPKKPIYTVCFETESSFDWDWNDLTIEADAVSSPPSPPCCEFVIPASPYGSIRPEGSACETDFTAPRRVTASAATMWQVGEGTSSSQCLEVFPEYSAFTVVPLPGDCEEDIEWWNQRYYTEWRGQAENDFYPCRMNVYHQLAEPPMFFGPLNIDLVYEKEPIHVGYDFRNRTFEISLQRPMLDWDDPVCTEFTHEEAVDVQQPDINVGIGVHEPINDSIFINY